MELEAFCAEILRLRENEQVLAAGEEVARRFYARYQEDRSHGKAIQLPDLISVKEYEGRTVFRVREVKFKLEEGLVKKALGQLSSALMNLIDSNPSITVDRVELIIPLRARKLKDSEKNFLGNPLEPGRHELLVEGKTVTLSILGRTYPVTALLL